jgi:hypothetical protein
MKTRYLVLMDVAALATALTVGYLTKNVLWIAGIYLAYMFIRLDFPGKSKDI